MGHLGVVSHAAVAVNAHRESPPVPSVLSRALVTVWGMYRGDRSRISPVTLRACKLRRSRNIGGPLLGRLCNPTTVVGWCFPGDFAKRGRK